MKLKWLLNVCIVSVVVFGFLLITGCSSKTPSSNLGPIVGQWSGQIQRDGNAMDAVLDVAEDGTSHFMVLGNTPGIQLIEASKDIIEKTGENTYEVNTSKVPHTYIYNENDDTFTDEKKQIFKRLDPYVGIWSGSDSIKTDNGNTATINTSYIIKPDGTGLMHSTTGDGNVNVVKITWAKDADGTYAITFSDGSQTTGNIDNSGMNMTIGDGSTIKKKLQTEWCLLSTTGVWYNDDTKTSVFFNGDGNGFINQNSKVINFNWELKDASNIVTTLVNDTAPDGTKIAQWTYNSDTNTLMSADGTVYSRPSESVEDLFTLY